MRRKNKLPELLAPAGDMECLHAAVSAGADAVYLGGVRFGARAFAKNFDGDELREAVIYAHAHGVRVYVTLNTLIYDKELDEAVSYAKSLHAIGVDALIAADVGVISAIRREVPELAIHASTQMGVHNVGGVEFASAIGCERAVVARECSLEDIRRTVEESSIEIEVFLHGALCVCHSGQCLFSSLVGGRSGNRGECAQPCRLPYGKGYPLSLRDLSLAKHVTALIESGVASLKIEGRMKSAAYVYGVTSIYRRLLDEHRAATDGESRELADIFSRGGFTDGYFTGRKQSAMTGTRSSADKEASKGASDRAIPELTAPLRASASIRRGESARLTLIAEVKSRADGAAFTVSASAEGAVPTDAITAPLTEQALAARLSKLGGTGFSLDESATEIELDDGLNLPPSAINGLRREAIEALKCKLSFALRKLCGAEPSDFRAPAPLPRARREEEPIGKTLLLLNADMLNSIRGECGGLGVDVIFVPLFAYRSIKEKRGLGIYLPPVVMQGEWERVMAELDAAVSAGADCALVGNISMLAPVIERGMRAVLDFRMNVTNGATRAFYTELGIRDVILSPELTLPMARDIGGAVITLGRIPLMLTERCFIKESFGCERCGRAAITDRMGAAFPLMREWEHRNLVLNSLHTYMGDKRDELTRYGIGAEHIIISTESSKEAAMLLRAYRTGSRITLPHRRIGVRKAEVKR